MVLTRQQDLLDEAQRSIQFQRIFSLGIFVEHAQMIGVGERAGSSAIRLDRSKQECRRDCQTMFETFWIVARVFVENAIRTEPRADRVLLRQAAVENGDLRF